jgi:hypothetical protein
MSSAVWSGSMDLCLYSLENGVSLPVLDEEAIFETAEPQREAA